jgi:hypothetical protein
MPPKTKADHRFKIKISGNPDKYVPGEVYTGKRFVQFLKNMRSHNFQNIVLLATVGLFRCGTALHIGKGKMIAVGESKTV